MAHDREAGQSERISFLKQAIDTVEKTGARYAAVKKSNVANPPIPYFGNPSTAVIATIGVNPSETEFELGRWCEPIRGADDLDSILIGYFTNATVPPHSWFKGWTNCLSILGHAYERDSCHLDLSPRATKSMGRQDPALFMDMVFSDLALFFSALKLCTRLRGALMAGSVTKRFYMDEFLRKYAPGHDFELRVRTRFEAKRRAPTALYNLTGPVRSVPVFFCSSGPGAWDKGERLASEVRRCVDVLKEIGF